MCFQQKTKRIINHLTSRVSAIFIWSHLIRQTFMKRRSSFRTHAHCFHCSLLHVQQTNVQSVWSTASALSCLTRASGAHHANSAALYCCTVQCTSSHTLDTSRTHTHTSSLRNTCRWGTPCDLSQGFFWSSSTNMKNIYHLIYKLISNNIYW